MAAVSARVTSIFNDEAETAAARELSEGWDGRGISIGDGTGDGLLWGACVRNSWMSCVGDGAAAGFAGATDSLVLAWFVCLEP